MLSSLKKFVLVALACVERLGQRPELDFKLPAGGSVPVLFSSLVSRAHPLITLNGEHSDFDGSCAQRGLGNFAGTDNTITQTS